MRIFSQAGLQAQLGLDILDKCLIHNQSLDKHLNVRQKNIAIQIILAKNKAEQKHQGWHMQAREGPADGGFMLLIFKLIQIISYKQEYHIFIPKRKKLCGLGGLVCNKCFEMTY